MRKGEGYHLQPLQIREQRDKRIVRLFDAGLTCADIAKLIGLSYEGTRAILQKAGRMGNFPRPSSEEWTVKSS